MAYFSMDAALRRCGQRRSRGGHRAGKLRVIIASKARVWVPIQSARPWIQLASAYVKFEAPSTSTRICAGRVWPVSRSTIRALGHLIGNGVHFGIAIDGLTAGEGVETILALAS